MRTFVYRVQNNRTDGQRDGSAKDVAAEAYRCTAYTHLPVAGGIWRPTSDWRRTGTTTVVVDGHDGCAGLGGDLERLGRLGDCWWGKRGRVNHALAGGERKRNTHTNHTYVRAVRNCNIIYIHIYMYLLLRYIDEEDWI